MNDKRKLYNSKDKFQDSNIIPMILYLKKIIIKFFIYKYKMNKMNVNYI